MSSNLTNFQKIREFHNASGLDNHTEHQLNIFSEEKESLIKLRLDLIQEEFNELRDAIKNRDFPEVRDAIADILYVVYGAAASFGIDADRDYDLVHKSNMSKLERGKPLRRTDGKILKGSEYFKPNLKKILDGRYK